MPFPQDISTEISPHILTAGPQEMLGDWLTRASGYCRDSSESTVSNIHYQSRMNGLGNHHFLVPLGKKKAKTLASCAELAVLGLGREQALGTSPV